MYDRVLVDLDQVVILELLKEETQYKIKGAKGQQDEAINTRIGQQKLTKSSVLLYINRKILLDEMGNIDQALLDYNKDIDRNEIMKRLMQQRTYISRIGKQ